MKNKQKSTKKIILLLAGLILVTLVFLSIGYLYARSKDGTSITNNDTRINFSPPTKEEQQAADTIKDSVISEQQKDNSSIGTTESRNANVIITDAGQYGDVVEVRAFIQNVYLDGTCTITFSKDSLTVTKKTPAYRDASTTICTNPEFKRSEFQQSGEWSVIVTYDATGSTGISEKKLVLIN